MAVIGSATLNIVPKVQGGLANTINGELKKANLSGLGKSAGGSFMGGFTNGASFGIWSTVASKAIDTVTASLGSAASRVDTLNNYPRIMESLGVSSEAAKASMDVMSTSLDNVPTKLDDMASTVQGIYAATMKYGVGLDTVTDAGLALNSMLLAGGQNQQVVNSAMEQFRQMVAKGKPDLQDWRSLISAAPGQMEQLAKSMLDAEASADDLYAALGGGKEGDYEGPYEWGSISMGEFVTRFSEMREQFEGAAQDAQGGIQTSFSNMKNAVTKGVANVLQAFGQERIASAIGDVKGMINDVFGRDDTQGLRAFATEVAPMMSDAWDEMVSGASDFATRLSPHMATASKTLLDFAQETAPAVGDVFSSMADAALEIAPVVGEALGPISEGAASIVKDVAGIATDVIPLVVGPLETAIPLVSDVVGLASDAVGDVRDMFKYGFEGAATGQNKVSSFRDALAEISGVAETSGQAVDVMGGTIENALERARSSAEGAKKAHEDYLDALARSSDVMREADTAHEAEVAELELAAETIDTYAGKVGLTSAEQRELKDALDTVNDACGTHYGVMEDGYTVYDTSTQKVQNNTDEIWNNVRAREAASRADALGTAKSEADSARDAAKIDFASQKKAAEDASDAWQTVIDKYGSYQEAVAAARRGFNANGSVSTPEERQAADAYLGWKKASEGMQDADRAQRELKQTSSELAAEQEALYRIAEGGEASISDLALSSGIAAEAFNTDQRSIIDFAEALETCVSENSAKKLKEAIADPDAMAEIVTSYDGTAASMEDALKRYGISLDEAAVRTHDAQGTISQMGDWLLDLGEDGALAMYGMGVNADEMALKLKDAGVSMEDLSTIGSEQFSDMLTSCSGDVDSMIGLIQLYNSEPVVDKDGNINIEDTALVDSQNNVYTWNGTKLVSKTTKASANDKPLRDAYGNVIKWNGTKGKDITANVKNTSNPIPTLLSQLDRFKSRDGLTVHTSVTNTTHNVTINETRKKVGGVIMTGSGTMAHGGHVEPRHASGYIAAGPTHTSWGLVGEDGIEAVYNNDNGSSDVYPLNNPRYLGYADPLADRIAKGIAKSLTAATGKQWPDVIINGVSGPDEVASAVTRALRLLTI